MSADCIFCRIASGVIPAAKIIEADRAFVIQDIAPLAKHHYLVIPKIHVQSLNQLSLDSANHSLMDVMFSLAVETAKKFEFSDNGFRTVINTGGDAGQTVHHLHLHVLGGEKLSSKIGA